MIHGSGTRPVPLQLGDPLAERPDRLAQVVYLLRQPVYRRPLLLAGVGGSDERPAALVHRDVPFLGERAEGPLHRHQRHAVLLREIAVGRQAFTRGVPAAGDGGAQVIGDLDVRRARVVRRHSHP